MSPNVLVIGAAKSATTSICELLGEHPDVFMSNPKEPGFFSKHYDRGWQWYEELFEDAGHVTSIGEGSTTYSQTGVFPEAPQRIAHHLPDARLIYICRHPLARLEAHWAQQFNHGIRTPPFCLALRELPVLMDASRYWAQISAYHKYFSEEQILVLFFEDFTAAPQQTLKRCFEFLGVDSSFQPSDASRVHNQRTGLREDRAILRSLRQMKGLSSVLRTVRDFVPSLAIPATHCFLKQPLRRAATWDSPTLAWAIEELEHDARTLLKHYGKPHDFWNLQAASAER